MLKYVLERRDNNTLFFLYYPEGNMSAPGRVAFSETGDRYVVEQSSDDFKYYYAGHALSGIDTKKEKGIVAWY